MALRLATAHTYDRTVALMTTRQVELSQQQEKLSAGKKVIRASDDPTGAAQAERAMTRSQRVEGEVRALGLQRNSVALAEGTLGNAMQRLQEIRELTVNAGNGTYSSGDRAALALQIRNLRDQLFEYANKTDSNGVPLFGGLGSSALPFVDAVAGVSFEGIDGTRSSTLVSVPGTLDGNAVWMNVPTGNGIFNAELGLGKLAAAMGMPTDLSVDRTAYSAVSGTAGYDPNDHHLAVLPNYPDTDDPFAGKKFNEVNQGEMWAGVGKVVNPSDLTGLTYIVAFNVNPDPGEAAPINSDPSTWRLPPVVTYDVYRYDPVLNPTAALTSPPAPLGAEAQQVATDAPYVDGKDIVVDGFSITAKGMPADGDTVSIAPSERSNVFAVIDRIIDDITSAGNQHHQLAHNISIGLAQLDAAMDRIQTARSETGTLLNRADTIEGTQEEKTIQLAGDRSRAEDMDMVKGISDYQTMQVGYQAALQTYAQIQRISLFNYIG